ncbi:MAG: NUDIX hydrolase [Polyangiaceae bacterium]
MFRLPPPTLRPWRRLRCEPLAAYRIFEVCRIELEDAAGRSRGDAFTLRGRDWCNVIAVTPDDRVVLVWQYRFGSDALSLEIPGGVIDPGEAPEQAARRELREETGYEAERFELLLAIEPNPAIQSNRCFTFVARGARATSATEFDGQEELETALVPAERIADLLDGGQVTHSLVQSALEAFWRRRRGDEIGEMERLVVELEELQRRKVVELARRLRPDLTPEDIRNPHDFPELEDPDWQYEDGILAGIQGVLAAVRAEVSAVRSRGRGDRPGPEGGG